MEDKILDRERITEVSIRLMGCCENGFSAGVGDNLVQSVGFHGSEHLLRVLSHIDKGVEKHNID